MLHLKELFEHREQTFNQETQQILEALKPTVTQGVCDFFRIHGDQLMWQDVRFGPHPTAGERVIVLAGVVEYRAGDAIYDETTNEFIPTEQPVTSMVKIMLPERVVETATADTISVFLKKIFEQSGQKRKQVFDNIAQQEPTPEESSPPLTDVTLTLAQMGFDVSTLNTQQIANIMFSDTDKRTTH